MLFRSVLVSISDKSRVLRVTDFPNTLALVKNFRIPVQLFPFDIAVANAAAPKAYVLNAAVNTLTAIDLNKVIRTGSALNFTEEPPELIADYRDAVIAAYRGLLDNLLQYLKDCFCDKFLVDCPDCNEKNKVYLGTVEIRDGGIYHICNFSKRKYVKTFRGVEYWMSVIPVLPLIKKAFATFCCWVIDFKGKV